MLTALGVNFWGVLRASIERYWWLLAIALPALIIAPIFFAQNLFWWLVSLIGTWMFDHIGSYSVTSGILDSLALANYILPVAEVATMTAGYVAVLAVMTVYRFVKSYVPNVVSGGT